MDDFGRLLFGHLARFHELVVEHTLHKGTAARVTVARYALALCWRDRLMFQPPEEPWLRWFEDHVVEAVRCWDQGGLALHAEERTLIARLQRDPSPRPNLWVTNPRRYEAAVQAEAATLALPRDFRGRKDCPPCWRCMYFDGWLPPARVPVIEYGDPEITEACANIDRRKVEVAAFVREHGR